MLPARSSASSRGDEAELLAAARILGLGYGVAMPIGNSGTYDLLVDTGEKVLKVQVKRAFENAQFGRGGSLETHRSLIQRRGNTPYKEGDFDYVVVVVDQAFYVVPFADIPKCRAISFYTQGPKKSIGFDAEQYKERWF